VACFNLHENQAPDEQMDRRHPCLDGKPNSVRSPVADGMLFVSHKEPSSSASSRPARPRKQSRCGEEGGCRSHSPTHRPPPPSDPGDLPLIARLRTCRSLCRVPTAPLREPRLVQPSLHAPWLGLHSRVCSMQVGLHRAHFQTEIGKYHRIKEIS
jgi:hypothetical protein